LELTCQTASLSVGERQGVRAAGPVGKPTERP
jgi:hypothetical protein